MSYVYWTADLDTGFSDIDEQHKILVDRINQFHTAWESNNRIDIKIALQNLIDCSIEHFAYEEKMLEQADYFMTEPHKKVHANFVAKMQALQGRYENGDNDAAKEILDLLEGWLFRHIRLNDHGYIEHVKASEGGAINSIATVNFQFKVQAAFDYLNQSSLHSFLVVWWAMPTLHFQP